MPGPVGGGRSGGGGGIGGGARGGGFSGGSHGGFSSGSNRTFRSGVPRGTGSFFTDSPDNPNGEEDTKKRIRNMIILVIFLAVFAGGPVISMVGNLFSDLASPSPDIWAEVDSVIIADDEWDSEYLITPVEGYRTKLDASLCTPIDTWYEDQAGLLSLDNAYEDLEAALKYFYEWTGVQPYLLIIDNIDGNYDPDWETVDNYLCNRYIELFGEDEGHYIFLYFTYEDTSYTTWYIPGLHTMEIMDDNAYYILTDYLSMYYSECPSWTEVFEQTFIRTAEDIMRAHEQHPASVPADPDYAEVSTYPPADTVPAVEVDSSIDLTSPVVELTSEPDGVVVEDMSDYTEESTTGILWDDDITEEPEEDFISDEALGAVFMVALAVTAFVVFVLWNRRKMRRLEEDM